MSVQNLRARLGARLGGDSEAGFTLIELLVVMLILGILAAIALPAFFNQKEKAGDAKAKENAHSAQVAIETYATENGGNYTGATAEKLKEIEPTIQVSKANETENEGVKTTTHPEGIEVTQAEAKKYTIVSWSSNERQFKIVNDGGTMEYPCTPEGGGCPAGGWGNG